MEILNKIKKEIIIRKGDSKTNAKDEAIRSNILFIIYRVVLSPATIA